MTDAPTAESPWVSRAFVLVILLACANLISQRMVDPDLWGHIQYGEDWVAEGSLPMTASHTYSSPDYQWVNHENLSELALAFGHRAVDGLGLMIGKCLLGIVMMLSMIRIARRHHVELKTAAMCMLPVALGLAEFWCARPQLASFLCMATMIVILEAAFRNWANDRSVRYGILALAIPVMIVWTNAHGGFVAGFCVFTAYVGIRMIESIWIDRKTGVGTAVRLGAVIVCCGAATLLNPYGIGLIQWLLKSLGEPRPEITEWVSIPRSGPTIVPFVCLTLLSLIAFRHTTKRRDPAHFVTILLVAVQTFMHCRHIAFLAILFGYWMPQHLSVVWQKIRAAGPARPTVDANTKPTRWWLAAQFGGVATVLAALLVWELSRFGVPKDEYPVDAVQFMADNDLEGKIVCTFNWAQYVLAAKPESTVSFDGRFRTCYPQSVVDMNFDLILGDVRGHRHRSPESGPIDPTRVLEFGKPDYVLIDRVNDAPAVPVMQAQPEWRLLYQDGMAQLWSRTSVDASADQPIPVLTDEIPSGIAAWPGFPNRIGRRAFVVNPATAAVRRVARRE